MSEHLHDVNAFIIVFPLSIENGQYIFDATMLAFSFDIEITVGHA